MQTSLKRFGIAALALCLARSLSRAEDSQTQTAPPASEMQPASAGSLREGKLATPPTYVLMDYDAPPYKVEQSSAQTPLDRKVSVHDAPSRRAASKTSGAPSTADTTPSATPAPPSRPTDDQDPSWITRQRNLITGPTSPPTVAANASPAAQDQRKSAVAPKHEQVTPARISSDPTAKQISQSSPAASDAGAPPPPSAEQAGPATSEQGSIGQSNWSRAQSTCNSCTPS